MTTYQQYKDIKCPKCGGDTLYHGQQDDACSDVDEATNTPCISTHDEDDEVWYVCLKCRTYQLQCSKCSPDKIQLCRFLGHEGVFSMSDVEKTEAWRFRIPPAEKLPLDIHKEFMEASYKLIKEQPSWLAEVTMEVLDQAATDQCLKDFPTSKNIPRYYVGDKNLYYADGREVFLTGPDGGFCHTWKCPSCQHYYTLTDK